MRFAMEHPDDDYEELLDAMADAADTERKRRRELGLCPLCAGQRADCPQCHPIGIADAASQAK